LHLKHNDVLKIFEFWVLREPPIQIPTQNREMNVLFNKFHRRINLVALLFSNSGSRNKTTYSEFRNESLKFEGPLRIVGNMWKVFTRPTCASDFFYVFHFISGCSWLILTNNPILENSNHMPIKFTSFIFQNGFRIQDGWNFSFCSLSFNVHSILKCKYFLETPSKNGFYFKKKPKPDREGQTSRSNASHIENKRFLRGLEHWGVNGKIKWSSTLLAEQQKFPWILFFSYMKSH
jgi:hypothetical protein